MASTTRGDRLLNLVDGYNSYEEDGTSSHNETNPSSRPTQEKDEKDSAEK
jgi:hypothetical protein